MQQEASDALSSLDRAFGAAMEQNRALMESMADFWRAESCRFFHQRLERTRDAMGQAGECRDLPGLLMLQKEWLGGLAQDYAAQSQRYARLWQQGFERLRTEMECQADAVRKTAMTQMDEAEMPDEAVQAAEEAGDAMAETHQDDYQPASGEQLH